MGSQPKIIHHLRKLRLALNDLVDVDRRILLEWRPRQKETLEKEREAVKAEICFHSEMLRVQGVTAEEVKKIIFGA